MTPLRSIFYAIYDICATARGWRAFAYLPVSRLLEQIQVKFKTIFILFNAILAFSFAFIFIMPFTLLGFENSLDFWARNWPMVLFFAFVIAGFNGFFGLNWKLFTLLESENWEALGSLLSDRAFAKGKLDRRTVRLLINTSLLRGDTATVARLEEALRASKPAGLRRDAVLFGAARLLANDAAASERFLAEFADGAGVESPGWIRFYHGFSLVLCKRAADAAAPLEAALADKDPVLAVLSAYVLGTVCAAACPADRRKALIEATEARRAAIAARFDGRRWAREVERAKGEVHIVIMSKMLDEASAWLLSASGGPAPRGTAEA